MTGRNWRRLNSAMPWLVIIGLIVLWQAAVVSFGIATFVLPAPTAVFAAFLEYRDPILHNALFTLKNTIFGFALGIAVGVMLGVVIGSPLRRLLPTHRVRGAVLLVSGASALVLVVRSLV